jgi:hypothetical protein
MTRIVIVADPVDVFEEKDLDADLDQTRKTDDKDHGWERRVMSVGAFSEKSTREGEKWANR